MPVKTFTEQKLSSYCRRAYNLARDAQTLLDNMTPYDASRYEDATRQLADGAKELYFVVLEALRRNGYNSIK